ncbi:SdiA-regulated domain-containing protein [Xylophilus sp. GOD-11R]|uniref:SdiA-regulated domain-containing protein n=1 Tax=Xylophilus sp. GOD-11R TaxID=3089814 RepID=UPI00298CA79E|nr:SdiA-regulated domain-containing protein [Xylophilus sp. GOD-11R]WPB56285.1 Ig-like domain-containing protein [Xylophilus sp. GOD-11R]
MPQRFDFSKTPPAVARQAGWTAVLAACAITLSACGGSNDPDVSGPVTQPGQTVLLAAPTLAFVSPTESLDLANYTLALRTTLPVDLVSGGNQIAAEVSAVTYNELTDSLFIIGDEGSYITQLSKSGAVIDTMNLPAGLFGDPEGITWAGGTQFVVANERERTANLVSYAGGTTLVAGNVRTVKLGTTVGNIGLEGVSRDPLTGGYIFVKEMTPQGIFQTTVDFAAGTASNGSATTVNSINLFDPALMGMDDIADVHALSNTLPATAPDYAHLMVLGQENGRILKVDRAGRIYGRLDLPNAPQNLGHEGITFDKQLNMYVTNEAGGGSQSLPQLWVYRPTRTAAQVGLSSNLYLTFTAPVTAGTGNVTLVGSNGETRTIAVGDATQVSVSGNTVKIDPTADLTPSVSYSLQFASGVFRDAAGQGTTAVNSAQTLAFTSVPDTTAPLLSSSTPADNASAVAVADNIVLTFNETVRAGAGTITITNGSSDVRVISAADTSQVTINGGTVTIDPTVDLTAGTAYVVQVSATALVDTAGNAFAGITDSTTLNFITAGAAPSLPASVLISELNSNANGGDFFEIYNYGTTPANLLGWRWDDDSADTSDAASVAFPAITLAPGARLVVVASSNLATFTTAWGLDPATFNGVALGGPGLGQGDAVVLFDDLGRVVARFNYGTAAITATSAAGTTAVPQAAAASGVTPNYGVHAGAVFGGSSTSSAVWDGVSTTEPAYRPAAVGVNGGFAQPASATSIGSPGL